MNELEQLTNKMLKYGLDPAEKLRFKELAVEVDLNSNVKCRCYTAGDNCRVHGVKYEIKPLPNT